MPKQQSRFETEASLSDIVNEVEISATTWVKEEYLKNHARDEIVSEKEAAEKNCEEYTEKALGKSNDYTELVRQGYMTLMRAADAKTIKLTELLDRSSQDKSVLEKYVGNQIEANMAAIQQLARVSSQLISCAGEIDKELAKGLHIENLIERINTYIRGLPQQIIAYRTYLEKQQQGHVRNALPEFTQDRTDFVSSLQQRGILDDLCRLKLLAECYFIGFKGDSRFEEIVKGITEFELILQKPTGAEADGINIQEPRIFWKVSDKEYMAQSEIIEHTDFHPFQSSRHPHDPAFLNYPPVKEAIEIAFEAQPNARVITADVGQFGYTSEDGTVDTSVYQVPVFVDRNYYRRQESRAGTTTKSELLETAEAAKIKSEELTALIESGPEAVVEYLKQHLGTDGYKKLLLEPTHYQSAAAQKERAGLYKENEANWWKQHQLKLDLYIPDESTIQEEIDIFVDLLERIGGPPPNADVILEAVQNGRNRFWRFLTGNTINTKVANEFRSNLTSHIEKLRVGLVKEAELEKIDQGISEKFRVVEGILKETRTATDHINTGMSEEEAKEGMQSMVEDKDYMSAKVEANLKLLKDMAALHEQLTNLLQTSPELRGQVDSALERDILDNLKLEPNRMIRTGNLLPLLLSPRVFLGRMNVGSSVNTEMRDNLLKLQKIITPLEVPDLKKTVENIIDVT